LVLKDKLGLDDPSIFSDDIGSSLVDNRSRLVTPGQQYSYSLALTAPQSPGHVIFPRWNPYYGPGTTVVNNFDWKMENYYNQSEFREFGIIEPEELPPIEVLERKGGNTSEYADVYLFINSPYSKIKWTMDQHILTCPIIQPMLLPYQE